MSQENFSREKVYSSEAAKKIFYKQFIHNEEYFNYKTGEKLMGLFNLHNFLGILTTGFYSNGINNIEILNPPEFDLSLKQEGGFTVFMWVALGKQQNNLMRYILKKGSGDNQITPTIGLLSNNTNIYIKVQVNKKTETLISNKKLEVGKIYSVALTISENAESNLVEISLYIDGILDTQLCVFGSLIYNNGSFIIGKPNNTTHGFVGAISEVMLVPYCFDSEEIKEVVDICYECFCQTNGMSFNLACVLEEKLIKKSTVEKYLQYTNQDASCLENLNVDYEEIKEIVRKYEENKAEKEAENKDEVKIKEEDDE